MTKTRAFPDRCPRCGEMRERDEYPDSPKAPSGKYGYCKPCKAQYMRERAQRSRENGTQMIENLKRSLKRYGVDLAWYEERMKLSGGRCEICGGGPTGNHLRLVIDHNHATGEARGLLCGDCNKALGALGDSPQRIRKAAEYLEERSHYGT